MLEWQDMWKKWNIFTRAGTIQSLSVDYQYRNQPIHVPIHTVMMLYQYRWCWQPHKTIIIESCGSIISHLTFKQLSQRFKLDTHRTNTLCIRLWYTLHRWSFCFSTSICWNHYSFPKTFTLLLKSKILEFQTLSHVHVYPIE